MLALPPELTQRQATACLRLLLQGLKAQPERAVRVDAKALTRLESTALAVLLECRRAALSERTGFAGQDLPLGLGAVRGEGLGGASPAAGAGGHGAALRRGWVAHGRVVAAAPPCRYAKPQRVRHMAGTWRK